MIKAWPSTCKAYEPNDFSILVGMSENETAIAWFTTKNIPGVGEVFFTLQIEGCRDLETHIKVKRSIISELNKTGWNLKF